MTDENTPLPEPSPETKTGPAPRVRRISNPRPKKIPTVVKEAEEAPALPEPVMVDPPVAEPLAAEPPVIEPLVAEPIEESVSPQEWPEPETISVGSTAPGEHKRKRRRRKGKGGQNSNPAAATEEIQTVIEPGASPKAPLASPVISHSQNNRAVTSPDLLSKKAWKIFLAEISEEGVALISDHDAHALSRRCFRLAEIFVEEQNRRR